MASRALSIGTLHYRHRLDSRYAVSLNDQLVGAILQVGLQVAIPFSLNILQAVGSSTGLPLTLGVVQFPGVVNVLLLRHRLDGGAAPAGEGVLDHVRNSGDAVSVVPPMPLLL